MTDTVMILVSCAIPILMTNFLRLLLPKECYIWFQSIYKPLVWLINIAATILIVFWLIMASVLLSSDYQPVNQWDELFVWAFALVPPVLLVLAKVLLKAFWKPTPEMLAHNDREVAKEIEQVRKQAGQLPVAENPGIQRYWSCPNCGSRNEESDSSCLRCGMPAALWGEKPVFFTEEEQ